MKPRSLVIAHRIEGDVEEVFSGFTEQLFLALAPAFPPTKLIRYDGNEVGDYVELRLGIAPLTQAWRSVITEHKVADDEAHFTDEGEALPFPLSYWRHKHIVRKLDEQYVLIIEDISYGTHSGLMTRVLEPILRRQFEARGDKYRAYFAARRHSA